LQPKKRYAKLARPVFGATVPAIAKGLDACPGKVKQPGDPYAEFEGDLVRIEDDSHGVEVRRDIIGGEYDSGVVV
jgi:hypothetical protein